MNQNPTIEEYFNLHSEEFKEWGQAMAKVLSDQARVTGELVQLYQDSIKSATEISNYSGELVRQYRESVNGINDYIGAYSKQIAESIAAYQAAFTLAPKSVASLTLQGWYPDFEMTIGDFNHLASLFESGKTMQANEILIDHFERGIKQIEQNLVKYFPHRAAVLKAAFKAQRAGDYYLSMPVFFAQAEGMCSELLGSKLFNKGQLEEIRSWARTIEADSILSILVEPLHHTGPAQRGQNKQMPVAINRHDVLHGSSWNYGAEKIDSFKTLSLLNYAGCTIYLVKEFDKKKIA